MSCKKVSTGRTLVGKIHLKCTSKWFTKRAGPSNVICMSIQVFNLKTLENTLQVSMKISSNTNVTFANGVLAKQAILKITSKLSMKTPNLSHVIYVIIQLSYIMTSEDTLNVFMKNSNNINVAFVKRALVGKVHSKYIHVEIVHVCV
jgi:hypothetical protein